MNILHWIKVSLKKSPYCAYEFHQNGPRPLIHDVTSIPKIGFSFKESTFIRKQLGYNATLFGKQAHVLDELAVFIFVAEKPFMTTLTVLRTTITNLMGSDNEGLKTLGYSTRCHGYILQRLFCECHVVEYMKSSLRVNTDNSTHQKQGKLYYGGQHLVSWLLR
jgi:hypothetical protein